MLQLSLPLSNEKLAIWAHFPFFSGHLFLSPVPMYVYLVCTEWSLGVQSSPERKDAGLSCFVVGRMSCGCAVRPKLTLWIERERESNVGVCVLVGGWLVLSWWWEPSISLSLPGSGVGGWLSPQLSLELCHMSHNQGHFLLWWIFN